MPKTAAQLLVAKLEQDPIQAVRLAIATVLLHGLNSNHAVALAAHGGVEIALEQADALIARTIGGPTT
jgi:hypothetical protein